MLVEVSNLQDRVSGLERQVDALKKYIKIISDVDIDSENEKREEEVLTPKETKQREEYEERKEWLRVRKCK